VFSKNKKAPTFNSVLKNKPSNAANQRLLEKPSLDGSTLHKIARRKPSRLPAHVVETQITVAGNTRLNKSLALAVRCIGLVRCGLADPFG
jgi:hypothetical protein